MESLYFLVPCALVFIAIAIKVFFWAINNGQYDNLDTEAHRILFDPQEHKPDQTPAQDSAPVADAGDSPSPDSTINGSAIAREDKPAS